MLLYCRSGQRSLRAPRALKSLGYAEPINVEGGIIAWEEAGYPTDHRQHARRATRSAATAATC